MTTRLRPYPRYKPSGVEWLGDVPANWSVRRLRFSVRINPPKSETGHLPKDTAVSFVPMEAVGEWGGLRLDQVRPLETVETGYTYFADGDVVFAKITPCFENGKGALAEGLVNGVGFGTTELHVLRARTEMDRRYLFYVTLGHAFRHIGASYMYGAGGQKRVPEEFAADFRHPVPPIEVQRSIAAFLDRETARIDALIEKKQRQIELLQEKRAALITHAVTHGLNPSTPMKDSGVEWLGRIPAEWHVVTLGRLVTRLQTGPFGSQVHAADYVEDGVPLINPAHLVGSAISPDPKCAVSNEMAAQLSRHRLMVGDIIFGRRGEMGRCALVTRESEGFLCGTGSLLLRPEPTRADSQYLSIFLSIPGVRDHLLLESVGSTMDNLNAAILARTPVALPPKEDQLHIVKWIVHETTNTNRATEAIEQSIGTLRDFRTAVVSAAVTGRVRICPDTQGVAVRARRTLGDRNIDFIRDASVALANAQRTIEPPASRMARDIAASVSVGLDLTGVTAASRQIAESIKTTMPHTLGLGQMPEIAASVAALRDAFSSQAQWAADIQKWHASWNTLPHMNAEWMQSLRAQMLPTAVAASEQLESAERMLSEVSLPRIAVAFDIPGSEVLELAQAMRQLVSDYRYLTDAMAVPARLVMMPQMTLENASREVWTTCRAVSTLDPQSVDGAETEAQLVRVQGQLASAPDQLRNHFPDLERLLLGAKLAVDGTNPDRARHVLVSLRELLTQLLQRLAPDKEVRRWISQQDVEKLTHNGRPTREARLRYICREVQGGEFNSFLKKDFQATIEFIDLLQQVHKPDITLTVRQLSAAVSKAESLVIFLCGLGTG